MDQEAVLSLPILTITDFATGVLGKELIVILAGEHAKELITSEIVLWLANLLTGYNDDEFLDWSATQPVQATAWKSGWTQGTLTEWAEKLLQKVVFKASNQNFCEDYVTRFWLVNNEDTCPELIDFP